MKLVAFTVRNYRSITSTSKLPIRDSVTTLIGPNNEGKSNVLRALVTAMEIVSRLDMLTFERHGRLRVFSLDRFYKWEADFPVALQETDTTGESQFDLDFALDQEEIAEFWTEVGSSLNGALPIRISIGNAGPKFSVRKKGPGSKALTAKATKIANFIGRRIDFQYIPAVRPASAATNVVEDIVSRELAGLATNKAYQEAVKKIEELQAPVLKSISETIRDTLKEFLPTVSDVEVRVPQDARYRALTRSCEVYVDDGTPTLLARKGDGVQSLAALSLMRHASRYGATDKQLILAIEEPESHLHPRAIHQLRGVLGEIAKQHQVIITTHCPLFVERRDPGANILVTESRASRAHSIQEIRDSLGVRVSDNLTAAEIVLLVEGEHDRRAMKALLAAHSPTISKALTSGVLAIDTLLGSGNLGYKLTQTRDAMCVTHVLIDHDLSGKRSVKRAEDEGLLTLPDVTYTTCLGMSESELEDLYDTQVYLPEITNQFGVSAAHPMWTSTKKKWSERVKYVFTVSGKSWDDALENQVKRVVSDSVSSNPASALLAARKDVFDSLVAALETKIANR